MSPAPSPSPNPLPSLNPLPPPQHPPPLDPLPDPPPLREDKEDKEELSTLPAGKGLTAVALSTASCFVCVCSGVIDTNQQSKNVSVDFADSIKLCRD